MNEEFEHPRLAAAYDALDPDRSDLLPYHAYAEQLGARSVLDLGCGTGTFAVALARAGRQVVGVDPAAASLDVARAKPGAEAVRWVRGDASALESADVTGIELVTMTANVAMFLRDDEAFVAAFAAIAAALGPDGHVVFETRVPSARAWEGWTADLTRHAAGPPACEPVEAWVETTSVRLPFVDIRNTFRFGAGTTIVSDATLRYRDLDEIRTALDLARFDVVEVADAPDRPGREWIVLARPRGFTEFRMPRGAG